MSLSLPLLSSPTPSPVADRPSQTPAAREQSAFSQTWQRLGGGKVEAKTGSDAPARADGTAGIDEEASAEASAAAGLVADGALGDGKTVVGALGFGNAGGVLDAQGAADAAGFFHQDAHADDLDQGDFDQDGFDQDDFEQNNGPVDTSHAVGMGGTLGVPASGVLSSGRAVSTGEVFSGGDHEASVAEEAFVAQKPARWAGAGSGGAALSEGLDLGLPEGLNKASGAIDETLTTLSLGRSLMRDGALANAGTQALSAPALDVPTQAPVAAAAGASVAATPLAEAARPQMPMTLSLHPEGRAEALAARTAWLVGQKISVADLQLDPPELGPLQVRVQVQQDQAVVSFVSANPQVREALEQSLPRLRELLQEQGLGLLDANVSGGAGQGADTETAESGASGLPSSADEAEPESAAESALTGQIDWGIDDFA